MSLQAEAQICGDCWEPDHTPENLLCHSWWESHTWSWASFTHLWKKEQTSPVQLDIHACSWGGCSAFSVHFETGVEFCLWLHMVTGTLAAISDFIFQWNAGPAHRIWLCFCGNNRRQRPPWRTAHRKMTTSNTLQSLWEPLAAWRKGQLQLIKEKWLFSSDLSFADTDTSLISDKSHHSYTNMVRNSGEWVVHAGFIDLQEPQNQCLLTQDHFQHKPPVCPWAAGVTLLSLQGQAPHAWGRMGDQVWAPFAVCWLGDVPDCAVAVWCEAEQPQSIFDPVLRLGHKHSTWERLAESGTSYMPCVSQHSTEWKCNMHCPSAGSGILQGGDWSLWAKGDLSYNSPFSHRSHLGHQGMGVQTQPQSHAPSGDKNYVLSFTGMVLIVRTPRGKTEHLNSSHSAVGCCYPLFVELRWPLPSCMVGSESWE